MFPTHPLLPFASTVVRWRGIPPVLLTVAATMGLLTIGCANQHHVIGLKPEPPFVRSELLSSTQQVPERAVDSLRPTFSWERFPRTLDRQELSGQISTVTYELRLWKVGREFTGAPHESPWIGTETDYKYSWKYGCRDTDPGELVYARQGLDQPVHTLETPLQPNSRYFWTVRAHFTLDGQRRATEWSEQLPRGTRVSQLTVACVLPATFHLIRTP
jgi:hypothetical protein